MLYFNGEPLNITIFPDKTSQVWKLNLDSNSSRIDWHFENEAEVFHIFQLIDLLSAHTRKAELHIPYLPYARQDKEVFNGNTFALSTFAEVLRAFHIPPKIFTIDVHSNFLSQLHEVVNYYPQSLIDHCDEYDVLLFPDEGAKNRYSALFAEKECLFCEKVRDPSTGKILYTKVPQVDFTSQNVVLVDDICDGGATFLAISRELHYPDRVKTLDLVVTHGIFSKGLCDLMRSFDRVITTDTLFHSTSTEYDLSYFNDKMIEEGRFIILSTDNLVEMS